MPLTLPRDFTIELPEIQEFANNAVGFAPNPDLPRVSEAQREQDALAYKEQMYAAENLTDSIRVANKYVSAAVEATVLGQTLIKYQTGLEKIRNETVKYQKAVTQTSISLGELDELRLKLNFQTSKLPILESGYNSRLQGLQVQAEIAQRETDLLMIERDNRFPMIDIEAVRSAA